MANSANLDQVSPFVVINLDYTVWQEIFVKDIRHQ